MRSNILFHSFNYFFIIYISLQVAILANNKNIQFYNKNPDKLSDGITIITNPEGKVLFADYFYQIPEDEEYTTVPITDKQLKSILEFFEDYKLQLDDSD